VFTRQEHDTYLQASSRLVLLVIVCGNTAEYVIGCDQRRKQCGVALIPLGI